MNESFLNTSDIENNIIDPVDILNQYAIYSSIQDDIIFSDQSINNPIFCGGFIQNFSRNVYNYRKNEFIGYISYKLDLTIKLSSNLIFKIDESNPNLIFILPYASYAMKILRRIDPKLGQTFIIIGLNFFSILLLQLIRLSGANCYIINLEKNDSNYDRFDLFKDFIIDGFDNKIFSSYEGMSNTAILLNEVNLNIIDFLLNNSNMIQETNFFSIKANFNKDIEKINPNNFVKISNFDIGFSDLDYNLGIKYPYSYIRWDYKKNLEYFIYLVENKLINITFLKINYIEVNSINTITNRIKNLESSCLFLFKLLSK